MGDIRSFKILFDKASYGYNYAKVFEDFLTICICAFSRNIKTGLSYYEDEYLEIIKPYKANNTLDYFPKLLAEMVLYMEENKDNAQGNDLLGEFFEQEITNGRNGQFFTPFPVCMFMSKITSDKETKSLNIIDSSCGSGRMLMAFAKNATRIHSYYGIDIDPVCVKMSAINLFLNGMKGEVICADALRSDDFRFGYRISIIPLGIFKIEKKEDSIIWRMNQDVMSKMKEENIGANTQLRLF